MNPHISLTFWIALVVCCCQVDADINDKTQIGEPSIIQNRTSNLKQLDEFTRKNVTSNDDELANDELFNDKAESRERRQAGNDDLNGETGSGLGADLGGLENFNDTTTEIMWPDEDKSGPSLGFILGVIMLIVTIIYIIGISWKLLKIHNGTYVEEDPVFLKYK